MPRQAVGQRPDQHFVRRRHRLQSLRGIHRVAGYRIGLGSADTQSARNHVPGIDADVELQRGAGVDLRTPAELLRPLDHVECSADSPLRIVLVRCWRAEQRQQRIADEFVHEAAKALHRFRQLLEQFVLKHLHDLGVEALAHRGEAAEIGKQHGNGAAVGFVVQPVRLRSKCLVRVDHRRQRR
ncbi:hypothetical protein GGD64_002821 [Bradyrhizobium sp. CIR3A]|nr:hypothetical protein [Bradyrhizobium sp. CIR3A]